jgi:hypothetical protein
VTHHNLSTAYASFGAKALNGLRSLSAIAEDGAVVLTCEYPYFVRSTPGILRYQDSVSRSGTEHRGTKALREHLKLANESDCVVRLVVVSPARTGRTTRAVHVRTDLTGRVTEYDGDRFVVDFSRPPPPAPESAAKRRARLKLEAEAG